MKTIMKCPNCKGKLEVDFDFSPSEEYIKKKDVLELIDKINSSKYKWYVDNYVEELKAKITGGEK